MLEPTLTFCGQSKRYLCMVGRNPVGLFRKRWLFVFQGVSSSKSFLPPAELSVSLPNFGANRLQTVSRFSLHSSTDNLSGTLSPDSKHNRPTHFSFCSPIDPPRLVIHENDSLHNFKPGGTCHITQDVDKLAHTSFFPLDVALCPDSCRVRRTAGIVVLPSIRHCSLLCPKP